MRADFVWSIGVFVAGKVVLYFGQWWGLCVWRGLLYRLHM